MKTKFSARIVVVALLALMSSGVLADDIPITGTPPLSSIAGGPFDSIDLANLNVHFSIPVFARPGKGIPFVYSLSYDSLVWVDPGPGTSWTPAPADPGLANWGWRAVTEPLLGWVEYRTQGGSDCETDESDFLYHDPSGGVHAFNGTVRILGGPGCQQHGIIPITKSPALDNSGYILTTNGAAAAVTSASGVTLAVPPVLHEYGAGSITDANGNTLAVTVTGSGNNMVTTVTDTLGTPALTIYGAPPTSNCAASPVQYKYSAPGGTAIVKVSYVDKVVQTAFHLSIGEFGPAHECLVDKVTLPDLTYYQFTYEYTNGMGPNVTGRIASIQLPTSGIGGVNGTIGYSYASIGCSNNPKNCMMADGSPSYMQRTLGGGNWQYTRSGHPTQTALKVVDPVSNETDLKFSSIYETERKVYQGLASQNQVLDYSYICYNGTTLNCQTATVTGQITKMDRYHQPGYGSVTSKVHTEYDQYGNATSEVDYDYPAGTTKIRTITNIYNGCTAQQICDELASTQILDSLDTQRSHTVYAYDQTGSQHGKVTQISNWTAGSNYLYQFYTYNANGTLATATDPNNTAVTYYCYGSSGSYCQNSNDSCNGAFPTTTTIIGPPVAPSTQYKYSCGGGVVTQVTDPNNVVTSTVYNDPDFWRPAKTTDALGNPTYYNYYGVTNNPGGSKITALGQTESVMSWTGSTADVLTTSDSYGRPVLQQKYNPQGQGTYDTVENYYDISGRLGWTSLPFTTSNHGPGTYSPQSISGNDYDTLGRVTGSFTCSPVSVCNGPTTWISYNLNVVDITQGPGQPFSKELEYDSLGRLTSVCEITSASDKLSCGPQSQNYGYPTAYTYDPLNNLTNVTQGVQSRSYSYDGLSRMTAETNPESGTTNYYFDSIGAGYCPAGANNQPGDLVVKTDAIGNNLCYYYDALHRLTAVGNNKQSTTNLCHRFLYDNMVGYKGNPGISVTYPLGRLVEAVTDNCGLTSDPIITDEWFSYSARGEPVDSWELTPHSVGWYHVQESYFPNGAMASLRGFTGTGTSSPFSDLFLYGLDGEGRPYNMSDSTAGTNIWASTAYNAANQPTSVQQSAGGGETFSYEPYQGQMQQWNSTVGNSSCQPGGPSCQTGILTWNANGTLYSMAISDPFNIANVQTCTNTYDDLARLIQNNCAGSGSQSFSYDQYGNITTAGSFAATYNAATNHVNNLGFSYDANGNVIVSEHGFNVFSYDVYNRPFRVNIIPGPTFTTVFDAFNRAIEQGVTVVRGLTTNTQFVFGPDGTKFAYMNGQALNRYMDPMVAGMQAVHVHDSSRDYGYFVHTDWLGSSRLGVTGGGAVAYDRAYAPFGAPYAELNNVDRNDRSFTGQNEDTTAGIYDFEQRQESQNEGRWFVPDPTGLAAVDITNPQTWNRYAYVGNQPLTATDPYGLYIQDCYLDGNCYNPSGGGGVSGGGGYYGGSSSACTLDGVDTSCSNPGGYRGIGSIGGNGIGICPADQSNCTIDANGVISNFANPDLLPGSVVKEDYWAQEQSAATNIFGIGDCFMHYGNWGGPCFSGGQWLPLELLTPQQRANLAGPIDARDSCYQAHDYCYYNARVATGTTYGSSPSSAQVSADTRANGYCDITLSACLKNTGNQGEAFFFLLRGEHEISNAIIMDLEY